MADAGMHSDHLVEIGEGWHLWRWFRLRGTGFPAARVLNLAVPDLGSHLERLFEADSAWEQISHDTLPRRHRTPVEEARATAQDAVRARLAECVQNVKNHLDVGARAVSAALRREARDVRFAEALTWQNRQAWRTGVEPLLRKPEEATDSRTRKQEHLVASYLQRYCTKNDTIGFFGPMGWGQIARHAEVETALRGGSDALSRRTVYFEWWAIHELANRLAAEPGMRPWLAPRRLPTVRLEKTFVHAAGRAACAVTPAEAWLLQASDGTRTARELAARAATDVEGLAQLEDVYAVLRKLEQSQWLVWTLNIPTESIHPEQSLRRQLETVGDAPVRDHAMAALAELEAGRQGVAAAAGTPGALALALDDLDARFSRLTDRRATRNEGAVYAGRGLVYEDCVRAEELTLGRGVVDRIGPALGLVLLSARWYSHALAQHYRALLDVTYAALTRETGQGTVDFISFLSRVKERFASSQTEVTPLVAEVVAELRARWAGVLSLPTDDREEVRRSAVELAPAVRERFDAPGPGWPLARYHAPDLLLAAPDLAAITRGEFLAVLGEVHVSNNTVLTPVFLKEFPHAAELLRMRAQDVPSPCIAPVVPAKNAHRAAQWSMLEDDFHLAVGSSVSWRRLERVLAAADLIVERRNDQLVVKTRSGDVQFDVLSFFQDYFVGDGCGHFSMLPSARHTPRVSIDELVIARERWCFEPGDVTFAGDAERGARLVDANLWARRHAVPRFVFVKVPEEPKPFYVDFHSPVLVELFAKIVRRATSVVVTEMLPAHEDLWLPDAAGNRYSCELRFAAVDPVMFRPPAGSP